MQASRSPAEAQIFGNRAEITEVTQLHGESFGSTDKLWFYPLDPFRNPRRIFEWRFVGKERLHAVQRISQPFLNESAPRMTKIVESPVPVSPSNKAPRCFR